MKYQFVVYIKARPWINGTEDNRPWHLTDDSVVSEGVSAASLLRLLKRQEAHRVAVNSQTFKPT